MLQKFWVCSQFEIKGVTAYAVCTCCMAACVLLMGVGRLLRSFTVNEQPCVQASLTHG